MGLYFLASLVAVGWLFVWAVLSEKDPEKYMDKGPFAFRDGEELHKKYGRRSPF